MNAFERRIDAAFGKFVLADERGECARGGDEHGFGNAAGAGADNPQTNAGKNVGVVALAGHERFPTDGHRRKRASACEHRTAFGPNISFFGGAFGFGGWIGQRKNHRPLVEATHGFDNFLRERLGLSGYADEHGGFK